MESLRRGLRVLGCFTAKHPKLRLTHVCDKTGLSPSTAHRILVTLVEEGFLEKSGSNKTYSVGLRAYTVGTVYLRSADQLIEATRPVLDLLEDLTHERVAIHVLDQKYCVLIASRECPLPIRFTEPIGSRTLAHCSATGKAMLSGLSSKELYSLYPEERLERLTDASIASRTKLFQELEQIRRRGVAFNLGENFADMRGVAAPIRNATGTIVAALSVAGPSSRIDSSLRNRLADLVVKASELVSSRLGYVGHARSPSTAHEIELWWETVSSAVSNDSLCPLGAGRR